MTKRWAALVAAMVAFGVPGHASENQARETRVPAAFDWMANGTQDATPEIRRQRAREAAMRARALNTNATWVCSPAGFGKKSRCHRG